MSRVFQLYPLAPWTGTDFGASSWQRLGISLAVEEKALVREMIFEPKLCVSGLRNWQAQLFF